VEPANVAVTAIKKATRGEGLIVRLHETSGDDTSCTLTINDVEYRGIHIARFAVETVRLSNQKGEWITSNHVET
jgi:alpha-mannosidase